MTVLWTLPILTSETVPHIDPIKKLDELALTRTLGGSVNMQMAKG